MPFIESRILKETTAPEKSWFSVVGERLGERGPILIVATGVSQSLNLRGVFDKGVVGFNCFLAKGVFKEQEGKVVVGTFFRFTKEGGADIGQRDEAT
jgi:hypothetical protein